MSHDANAHFPVIRAVAATRSVPYTFHKLTDNCRSVFRRKCAEYPFAIYIARILARYIVRRFAGLATLLLRLLRRRRANERMKAAHPATTPRPPRLRVESAIFDALNIDID